MKIMSRVATFAKLIVATLAMVLTACGGGSGNTTLITQLRAAQTALSMKVGESRTVMISASASALRATAKPSEICSTTIDGNTLTVTGVSGGSCEVVVSDGNGNITVTAEVGKMEQLLKVVPKSREIEVGHTGSITFDTPSTGLTTASVSDSNVCSVLVNGNTATLTGLAVGECKVTASNGGDNVYAFTSIDLAFTVTAPVKADQKALTLSTTKLSLESDIAAIYNSSDVSVYGGSGNGQLSAMTSDQNCTVVTTGTKDRDGGDIFTITGAVQDGICTVTFTKAGDIDYNTASVVLIVDIQKFRDKLAAAAAAYNADKSVYHPSGINNPVTSVAGSDVIFHPQYGKYTGPDNICIVILGSTGQEKGYFEIPYDSGTPEYTRSGGGTCNDASTRFQNFLVSIGL